MLKELDAVDAGGPRSSTTYAYSGFRVNVVNQYVLVAGGYWTPGEPASRSLDLIRVGAADLWYRMEHGYSNYAKGSRGGTVRPGSSSAELSRSLWDDVLLPHHERSSR